jgi:hypothetical protein
MSRDLMFRCWDKRHKEMFYSNHEKRLATFFDLFAGECCTEIIMQYTGLKDKNDKEIYDGDVVKADNMFPSEVIFEYGTFRFKGGSPSIVEDWHYYSDFEVIGNKYQNPELLGSEKSV